jgi:hypothetical protein
MQRGLEKENEGVALRNTLCEHPLVCDDIRHIARHKQVPGLGEEFGQISGQVASGHFRHNRIRTNQVNLFGLLLGESDCFPRRAGG